VTGSGPRGGRKKSPWEHQNPASIFIIAISLPTGGDDYYGHHRGHHHDDRLCSKSNNFHSQCINFYIYHIVDQHKHTHTSGHTYTFSGNLKTQAMLKIKNITAAAAIQRVVRY